MSTVRKEEGGTEETPTQEKGVWTRQEAGGMNWEIGTDVCALPCAKHRARAARCRELSWVLCDDLDGWDGVGDGQAGQKSGDVCIHQADSLSCIAETSTTL